MNQMSVIKSAHRLDDARSAPASPATISSFGQTSAKWNAVRRLLSKAEAAADAYYESTYGPAWQARNKRREEQAAELQRQIDAVPHYTTTSSYKSAKGEMVSMTTADRLHTKVALDHHLSNQKDDFIECCRELFRAISERFVEAQKIRDGFVALPIPEIAPHIEAKYRRLEKARDAAYQRVLDFKPRSHADLIAKVEFLKEHDCEINHDDLLSALACISTAASA